MTGMVLKAAEDRNLHLTLFSFVFEPYFFVFLKKKAMVSKTTVFIKHALDDESKKKKCQMRIILFYMYPK